MQLRKEKGKALKEVVAEIGLSVSAYSNYEQGIRESSFDILKKIYVYF